MSFVVENWYLFLGFFAIGVFIGASVMSFIKEPNYQQIEDLKNWLKIAMYKAEKELGSKTGELKLLTVYNMFVVAMPWMARVISFDQFNEYVLGCMDWLNQKLEDENEDK